MSLSLCFSLALSLFADSLSPPVNVTIKAVKANSAVVTWDIPEGDPVIGFAITQQVINKQTQHKMDIWKYINRVDAPVYACRSYSNQHTN